MGAGFDKLMKAINFERTRSQQSVPMAKKMEALISEKNPFFECKNGTRMQVDGRDLEKVLSLITEDQVPRLSLPIYFKTAPSLGHGFHQLLGVDSGSTMEKLHKLIVFGILGTEPRTFLYGYEVQRLKREIPSVMHVFY